MAFKLTPPYDINNTPIYRTLKEDGVLGVANKNGTIRLHTDLTDPIQMREVIDHEMVHLDQMDKGLLDYDNDYIYQRDSTDQPFKKIARGENDENAGKETLPHEKEANNKAIQKQVKNNK